MKDGALARVMGLKDQKIRDLSEKAIGTFKIRCEKGVQRDDMWSKYVEDLVQIIDYNTLNSQGSRRYQEESYQDERKHTSTILRDPLSRNDIAALENRLGISLPDDYKEFLAITNGIGES